MKLVQSALARWPDYARLEQAVEGGAVPGAVTGLSGVHKCCVIASLCKKTGRRALVLAADEAEAQRFCEDLAALGLRPVSYPLRDFNFRDTAGTSHEYERLRLEALSKLEDGQCDCIVACMDAALQYTLGPEELERKLFTLRPGDQLEIADLLEALVKCGYTREDQIEGPGQFSHRGGIVDFFSPSANAPVRVEFWGDEVDSLSSFDMESQRRTESIPQVTLAPCVEVIPEKPAFLAQKIEKLAASLRGKNAPKAKEVLRGELLPAGGQPAVLLRGEQAERAGAHHPVAVGGRCKKLPGGGPAVQGPGPVQPGLGVRPGQGGGNPRPVLGLVRPGQL